MNDWDDNVPYGQKYENKLLVFNKKEIMDKMFGGEPAKYEPGVKYLRRQRLDDNGGVDRSSPLILCTIRRTSYRNEQLGWIYDAIAEQPVEHMDCNWNTSSSAETFTSDEELDGMVLVDGVYTPRR